VRCEIVTGRDAVAAVIDQSRNLMRTGETPVTARADWLTAVLHHLPGSPTAVVVRASDGALAGVALLSASRTVATTVRLLGHGVSDHARLLARDSVAADVLADGIITALRRIRGPWRLCFEQLPEGDPVVQRLTTLLPRATTAMGDPCPVTRFGTERVLSGYLSKNGRGIAGQGRNRLTREDPDWRIERTRDPAEIELLLPTIVALRRLRDHALGRRSDLDDGPHADFYVGVARVLAEQGCLEVATVRVHGAVAAYLIVILDGSTWRFWDNRIDPRYLQLRVGRVLDSALLTAALEDPSVTSVDWMRGQMQHKKQAANDECRTVELYAWSGPATRAAEQALHRGRSALRQAVPDGFRRRVRGRSRGVRAPAGAEPVS
jgi:CelD/BcsL family acetyltransferase involved in cellulose biosynthesis